MIVLDSSLLIAYHNQKDVHHRRAVVFLDDFVEGKYGRGLLLEYVFLEVMTVLTAKLGLVPASEVGQALLNATELDFLPCSDFFDESWECFRNQRETAMGFADAAIVAAARKLAGGFVATFDAELRNTSGIRALPAR
ncbi:MAG: PIN domain-containing protein [Acidimicrobiia bacterium]|nr:PIN domain-containing protein [Acidimicrobiia bacterium]